MMEEIQMPSERRKEGLRNAKNWKFLAVVITAALLPTALMAIILTAPISEMHIRVWNVDEVDTVHILLLLDESREVDLYAGPGGLAGWVFHVSPGTHSIGVDFLFNYSYDNPHDEIIDYLWTARVEFNGILHDHFCVDSEGINTDSKYDLIDVIYLTKSPLEQAVHDPHFIFPIAALSVLHVLFLGAFWNYLRTSQRKELREKRP